MFKKCLIYFHFVKETTEAKFSEEVDGQVTWKGVPNLVSPEFDRKTRDHNSEQMLGEGTCV